MSIRNRVDPWTNHTLSFKNFDIAQLVAHERRATYNRSYRNICLLSGRSRWLKYRTQFYRQFDSDVD